MIGVNTLEYINLIVTDNKGYLIDRNGVDSIVNSSMQTFGGEFLIPNEIDRIINVYYHLATTQYFSDGNKRTAELSLKMNCVEYGYSFEAKDGDIAKITMDVANHRLSEEDCRILLRKYIK